MTKAATDLDFAILGLLHQQPETGYGIRMIFETTALGTYSSSPGSIYPALKRLQKLGMIEQEAFTSDTGKTKPRYKPTMKGEQALVAWMTQEITDEDISKKVNLLLLRFAFMDHHIGRSQKVAFLQSFIEKIEVYLDELKAFHRREAVDLPLHGRLAFEHGIALYHTHLEWGQKALTVIQQTENHAT